MQMRLKWPVFLLSKMTMRHFEATPFSELCLLISPFFGFYDGLSGCATCFGLDRCTMNSKVSFDFSFQKIIMYFTYMSEECRPCVVFTPQYMLLRTCRPQKAAFYEIIRVQLLVHEYAGSRMAKKSLPLYMPFFLPCTTHIYHLSLILCYSHYLSVDA